MARPREFDETEALEAAVNCFWRHGYEATSVRDLAERMGITGASLYNAFGDKRALFRLALDHYVARMRQRLALLESTLPPRQAIEEFFQGAIDRSLADHQHRGCMLVNTALELGPHDPEFRRVICRELSEIEDFFRRCLTAGQRAGTISDALPAEDVARNFLGVVMGLRVLVRARPERALIEGVVRPALSLLDATSNTYGAAA